MNADSLISAMEEGRSRSTAKREVRTLDDGRHYLFPTMSVAEMLGITKNHFFYIVRRAGVTPSAGTGGPYEPFLWDAEAINKISAARRQLRKYKEPRGLWGKTPVTVEVVTR